MSEKESKAAPAAESKAVVPPPSAGSAAATPVAPAAPVAPSATPAEPRPKTLVERAEGGEKLTPEELAEVTENRFALRPNIAFGGGSQQQWAFSAAHSSAANDPRYGWNQHNLDSAEPFRLTKTAYVAALKAVMVDGPTVMDARSPFARCAPCVPQAKES